MLESMGYALKTESAAKATTPAQKSPAKKANKSPAKKPSPPKEVVSEQEKIKSMSVLRARESTLL
jgi:hypothetical protein